MSTNAQAVDVGVLEKIGETLSAFSDNFGRFLTRLFGSSNERFVRKLGYVRTRKAAQPYSVTPGSLLAQMNALEEKMRALSDEELKGLTPQLRERLASG